MPSATFFNLPAEKRDKLLAAACEEFARVPFAEASVNKIIQAARIPRGSFYQYFTDKEDLFRFFTTEFNRHLIALVEARLEEHGGDLFAALPDLFDYVMSNCRSEFNEPHYRRIIQIIGMNQDLGHGLLVSLEAENAVLRRMCELVDGGLLDLREEGDLRNMILILSRITGPALVSGILSEDPQRERKDYLHALHILARGMAKSPSADVH